jgi:hypothetical protein
LFCLSTEFGVEESAPLFDNTESSGVHISIEGCTKIRDEIVTFFDSDNVIGAELKTPRKRTNSVTTGNNTVFLTINHNIILLQNNTVSWNIYIHTNAIIYAKWKHEYYHNKAVQIYA